MHKSVKDAYSHPIMGTLGLSPVENAVLGALVRFCLADEVVVDSTIEQICSAANISYGPQGTKRNPKSGWKSSTLEGAISGLIEKGLVRKTELPNQKGRKRNRYDLSGLLSLSSSWPAHTEMSGYRPEYADRGLTWTSNGVSPEDLTAPVVALEPTKRVTGSVFVSERSEQAKRSEAPARGTQQNGDASAIIAPPFKKVIRQGIPVLEPIKKVTESLSQVGAEASIPLSEELVSDWSSLTNSQIESLKRDNLRQIRENEDRRKALLLREDRRKAAKAARKKSKKVKLTSAEMLDVLLGSAPAPVVEPTPAHVELSLAGPDTGERMFRIGESKSHTLPVPRLFARTFQGLERAVRVRSQLDRGTCLCYIPGARQRCPAKMGHNYTPGIVRRGDRRNKANVQYVDTLWLDIDKDDGSVLASVRAKLDDNGLAYILYGTHSDGRDGLTSVRIIIPLSEPVPGSEWDDFWLRASQVFRGIDSACRDASHIYFSPGPGARVEVRQGATLNVDAIRAVPLPVQVFQITSKEDVDTSEAMREALPAGEAYKNQVLKELRDKREPWGTDGRKRHLFSAASWVVTDAGLNEDDAIAVLMEYSADMPSPLTEKQWWNEVRGAFLRGQPTKGYGYFRRIREPWCDALEQRRAG